MRVVITGSAGAIGSHMAEQLAREGHTVSGIDAFTDYYDPSEKRRTAEEMASAGIRTYELDLATDDLHEAVPDDTGFIIHFAAQPGISATTPYDVYEKNNMHATARLLARATELPAFSGFLHIATSSIYGVQAVGNETSEPRPTSFYGATKLGAEQLALSYARRDVLPVASVRPFSVYGERERPDKLFRKLIAAIDEGKPFPLHEGSREHRRSFTYVGDIVDGVSAMMAEWDACVGEVFNLGTEETHTTGEGIDLVEELMGKKGVYEVKPKRPGDQKETAADITKAREVFGYAPVVSLREGLAREIAWYRAHARA
ncbi:MAG TPA: NAD-dependent epimerase/dehydratase family protein [Candidatus Paceibacterota bacterium]